MTEQVVAVVIVVACARIELLREPYPQKPYSQKAYSHKPYSQTEQKFKLNKKQFWN